MEDTTKPQRGSERAQTHARVVALWDGGSASYWLPPGAGIAIGRSSECELVVDDTSVSRKHAYLHFGDVASIEDLGSQNGVRVRGKRIEAHVKTPFSSGEVVELGSTALVVVAPTARAAEKRSSMPPSAAPTMESVQRLIRLLAQSDLSVMILGETGVGKNVVAEAIHRGSPRARAALVKINCAALPETLLESELFGYERGAFTGANRPKPGLIEAADGGTLLLDEIGEMPPATQAKLLTVMESRELLRLGSVKPTVVDVRFLAATNVKLEELVRRGGFRADLYYRLNGATIAIPPLRERKGEIPELVDTFLKAATARSGRAVPSVGKETLDSLVAYAWPGNIRELRNAVERAVALSAGEPLGIDDFFPQGAGELGVPSAETPEGGVQEREKALLSALSDLDRERVATALNQAHGNQTHAAELLGISRRTLIARMEAYDLPRPRKGRLK